ncbi:hypothetical protein SDC9_193314 [bioreactor metagenome]|uniref:Uncharacterized protein n=1 Tax=bioreactor metagenome TaxID=1076179 RepID=A0A645IEB3_9ZZZZ
MQMPPPIAPERNRQRRIPVGDQPRRRILLNQPAARTFLIIILTVGQYGIMQHSDPVAVAFLGRPAVLLRHPGPTAATTADQAFFAQQLQRPADGNMTGAVQFAQIPDTGQCASRSVGSGSNLLRQIVPHGLVIRSPGFENRHIYRTPEIVSTTIISKNPAIFNRAATDFPV